MLDGNPLNKAKYGELEREREKKLVFWIAYNKNNCWKRERESDEKNITTSQAVYFHVNSVGEKKSNPTLQYAPEIKGFDIPIYDMVVYVKVLLLF